MADYSADVVRYVRRHDKDGFSGNVTYLGAEQRFVGGLRNSNVNNLEEQFIVGADSRIECYYDDNGNAVECREYYSDTDDPADYYKLITTTINEDNYDKSIYFEDGTFYLRDNNDDVNFFDSDSDSEVDTFYLANTELYDFDDDTIDIFAVEPVKTGIEELYFVSGKASEGNEVHVLTKNIERTYVRSTGRDVVKEVIVNHIGGNGE